MHQRTSLFTLLIVLIAMQTNAQDTTKGIKSSHRLSFGLGHTSISEGRQNGQTQWLPLASWSLNYDYWFNNKWAIGFAERLDSGNNLW